MISIRTAPTDEINFDLAHTLGKRFFNPGHSFRNA
jgi:hypothetical protein